MQKVSKAYKKSIRQIGRNRGYCKITIGIVNSEAQRSIEADSSLLIDYSKPFIKDATKPNKVYATTEQNFVKADGNYYFLPLYGGTVYDSNGSVKQYSDVYFNSSLNAQGYGYQGYSSENPYVYNSGLVSNSILGTITFRFGNNTDLDIKGFTIDFSDCYPTKFIITNGNTSKQYTNDTRYFSTEDSFDNTEYISIIPTEMLGGNDRLRIYEITCGIANVFTNNELINYSNTEYVSAICETVPSNDVRIEVVNKDLYYCPDNPESALAYMEIGQEVKVEFGYDVNDDGNIEWLPPQTSYLQTWSADKERAEFTSTDRYDNINTTFYGGKIYENGITLYDLAEDVLEDAGIDDYYLDSYLKEVKTFNPMPPVEHTSALQIIANAGRCTISEDRQGRVRIQSNFIPAMETYSTRETSYSDAENLVNGAFINHYAEASKDYTSVDGLMNFYNEGGELLSTGYISDVVADSNGNFSSNPTLTLELEATYAPFSFGINFNNTHPSNLILHVYADDIEVDTITDTVTSTEYVYEEQIEAFDKLVIEFTKGYPNSRVFVDSINLGIDSDYHLEDNTELKSSPKAIRQTKIQNFELTKTEYIESDEDASVIYDETVALSTSKLTHICYLSSASYNLSVNVLTSGVSAQIVASSAYFVKLQFSGISSAKDVEFEIIGNVYDIKESTYTVNHNEVGEIKTWNNPLVSTNEQAKVLEEWLYDYFNGDIEYEIEWRGDPRVDANDMFFMDNVLGETVQIRAYSNTLNFSNAGWSGQMKARKVITNE